VIRERFRYPSTARSIETYGVVAIFSPLEGAYTIWANFMGPFIMHPSPPACRVPENKLRFIVPGDSAGASGSSRACTRTWRDGARARLTQVPVKWIETGASTARLVERHRSRRLS